VDGDLLPLLYSLPRPQHHREVLGVYSVSCISNTAVTCKREARIKDPAPELKFNSMMH